MKYAKGPYVNGIKVLNHLPRTIKTLEHSPVKFKNALKTFFHQHPFYSISNKGIRHGDHVDKGTFCSDLFLTYFHIPITFGIVNLQKSFHCR